INRKATETAEHRKNSTLCLRVSVADLLRVLRYLCVVNVNTSERVPEHDLCDSHEPGLHTDLTEVRVAERGTIGPHVAAVQQIQHLDLDLRRLRPEPQILDEYAVNVGLHW